MLKAVEARLLQIAQRRTQARARAVLERLRGALPADVSTQESPDGAIVAGRGLKRRFALDPALRWLSAGLR